jgi:hypothetical protein
MTVLLLNCAEGEFCLRQELVSELSRLGVSNVALVRDEQTVAVVLEGWMFDPERSAEAAAHAVRPEGSARTLRPVMQVAVANAVAEGG